MKLLIGAIAMSIAAATIAGEVQAAGYPWKDHAAPYDFVFENELDTHQQTRQTQAGGLSGFLYIHYTGATTTDGLPVAEHGDCASVDCDVGWHMSGVSAVAAFLYHIEGDHPVWLVDRRDIPQPGAYAHFHWLGEMPMTRGEVSDGYLLELRAVRSFCFIHHAGGTSGTCEARGGVAVRPGIDIATHVNIVASAP
jgi:hypothetical protein